MTSAVAGMLIAFGFAGHAYAVPSPADLEAQIDDMWNKLEPTIEKHNMIRAELNAKKAQVAQLTAQIAPLQARVDAALDQVSALSARYYIGGPASAINALLSIGSPTALADQLGLLNVLARNEQAQIKDVVQLKQQYDAQKQPLDKLVAELTAQEAELASTTVTINTEIKRLNQLRLSAYGSTGGMGVLRPVACPVEYAGGAAAKAAQVACQMIGRPYVFGAGGPGSFDCSGLTMYAWGQAGKTLRHYTKWQYSDSRRITRAELRAGDLVFFYSDLHHMGLYVGGGYMVHAPHAGDVVRMAKIDGRPITGYGRVGT